MSYEANGEEASKESFNYSGRRGEKMENSVVISVNTISERDLMIKDLYRDLTTNSNSKYTVVQDRINRIRIFQVKENVKTLINTYIVVIIPIYLNFSVLDNIYGTVDFRLDATIEQLQKLVNQLRSIQGKRVVKMKFGAKNLKNQLVSIL